MERMLTCLQLPTNLKMLRIMCYTGDGFPRMRFARLTNLVSVSIEQCKNCRVLPHLSQLPHLKSLTAYRLEALEYIEDDGADGVWGGGNGCGESGSASHNYRCYFPALESLDLMLSEQLKGWTRSSIPETATGDDFQIGQQMNMVHDDNDPHQYLFFSRLLRINIDRCPKLMSMPLIPRVKPLKVNTGHGELLKSLLTSHNEALSSLSSLSSSITLFTSLKELEICGIDDCLISLTIRSSWSNLEKLCIGRCNQLSSLIFESPNSIRDLHISLCRSLRNISGGLQHLIALKKLHISSWPELDVWNEEEEKPIRSAWQGLRSLRSLELQGIHKLKALPRGITGLTTLQSLTISYFKNLRTLPEETGQLSHLRQLSIKHCPKLASFPQSLRGLTSLQQLHASHSQILEGRYKSSAPESGISALISSVMM